MRISIDLEDSDAQKLEEIAKKSRRTRKATIEVIIQEHLKES